MLYNCIYLFGEVQGCSASCIFTRKWTRRNKAHARQLIKTLYSGIHIVSVQVTLKVSTVLKMKHRLTSFMQALLYVFSFTIAVCAFPEYCTICFLYLSM